MRLVELRAQNEEMTDYVILKNIHIANESDFDFLSVPESYKTRYDYVWLELTGYENVIQSQLNGRR